MEINAANATKEPDVFFTAEFGQSDF